MYTSLQLESSLRVSHLATTTPRRARPKRSSAPVSAVYLVLLMITCLGLSACDASESQSVQSVDTDNSVTSADTEADTSGADAETNTSAPDGADGAVEGDSKDPDSDTDESIEEDALTGDATVRLPIEVLGAPGTIEAVTIHAPTAGSPPNGYLWLHTHRLTWREDGEFARTDAPRNNVRPGSKGSARLNGGPWVPLTNATVTCEAHEAEMGCLNGSYQAVRVRVALERLGAPGLLEGENLLELRFDETDGISSGWRVLALDVRDAAGASLLSTKFVEDDPDAWAPPLNTPADIAAGQQLWSDAALTDLGFAGSEHPIQGKCASCHFSDGYDLAYFNYSNRSIIARSTFHGLSEREGQQIASYIRALPLQIPSGYSRKDAGRPWNPPYQPGPGLDARPVELWAAGAGLGAVLERDAEMRRYLFPDGAYRPEVLGASGSLNPRELPQALQYPDWNTWLPTIAPEDMVTDPSQLSTAGALPRLEAARAFLREHRQEMNTDTGLSAQGTFIIRMFCESRLREGEGFPTRPFYTDRDIPSPPRTVALSLQQGRQNLAYTAWFNLRQFELFHRFDLEDWTDKGNAAGSPTVPAGYRSWGQTLRTVFETAPHFVTDHPGLDFNFTQPGNYLSTSWYSLEQIVNGGIHAGAFGIDWNYHPAHITNTHHSAVGFYDDGPIHAYRLAWARLWIYQSIPLMDLRQDPPTPFTPKSFGFPQRQIGQGLDLVYGADLLEALGEITHADRAQLQEALALAFLEVAERYQPEDWVRRDVDDDAHRSADTFETIAYAPDYNPDFAYDLPERGYQADAYYLRIKLLKDEQLVSDATLTRLVDWGESIWPLGAWSALRP
jgi:hypothetical protein